MKSGIDLFGFEKWKAVLAEYDFQPIIQTMVREHWAKSEGRAMVLLEAFLQWFLVANHSESDKPYVMFHGPVDRAFHAFVLNTSVTLIFAPGMLGDSSTTTLWMMNSPPERRSGVVSSIPLASCSRHMVTSCIRSSDAGFVWLRRASSEPVQSVASDAIISSWLSGRRNLRSFFQSRNSQGYDFSRFSLRFEKIISGNRASNFGGGSLECIRTWLHNSVRTVSFLSVSGRVGRPV